MGKNYRGILKCVFGLKYRILLILYSPPKR